MTDSTEVKASIKLRFKNKRGQDAVVVRSLQVTRKKTKLEYKALEGVIRMTNEDGETVSLSHKCSELDKHIPELLGVSAAVMESVIFCHQEESSWPLGESAILKKKFDDIFESTRFAKALEVIMKTKKEYAVKAKDLKCELVELAAHLGTHQDETGRRAACVDKKERCEEELARIAAGLERLQDKTRAATEVLRRTEASSADLRQAEWELKTAEIRLDEKQAGVDQLLSDADDVLESQVSDVEGVILLPLTVLCVARGLRASDEHQGRRSASAARQRRRLHVPAECPARAQEPTQQPARRGPLHPDASGGREGPAPGAELGSGQEAGGADPRQQLGAS
jgi:DNA repair protein RAD50